MHMKRKSLLLLFSALLASAVQDDAIAQTSKYRDKANDPVEKLGYEKKLRWADNLFKQGGYINATDYYTQLLQEQPRNPYLHYQLGESYFYLRDYVMAAKHYGKSYELASTVYPEAVYKEAKMLKMSGEYDKAIQQFNKFITDNPKTYKKLKKSAQLEIDGAEMGKKSILDPIDVNIFNVGPNVNTAYTELAPIPLGDTALLFATMKSNTVVDANKERREDYVSRFMVSHKFKDKAEKDTFQWALPFTDGNFNDPKFHVGNASISPGGDRFYFTKCLEADSNQTSCRIFVSEWAKDRWTEPAELGFEINQNNSSSTHPHITTMGKKEILFFASDRKLQSRGGYDIWYSVYDPRLKSYRRPQNAGKQINTDGDELTPYYDTRTDRLYFASNGWKTLGGLDIFSAKSLSSPSRYEDLTNLGYPINTPADELYYVLDPSGKPDAYVVSNRIGSTALKNPTCCDDIWRIQYEPQLAAQGKVLSQKTQQPVTDVVVKMVDENGNIKTFNSTDGNFDFRTARGHNYVITADKQNHTSTRAVINTQNKKRTDKDDTVKVVIYVDEVTMNENFSLDNILYSYDDAKLLPESAATLEKLIDFLKDNPSLDIEIHSHTDSKGDATYNKNLSQRRAQSVVDYLIENGIGANRLKAVGFGKEQPITENSINGKDNPAGRALNRRTEFKVISDVPTRRLIFDSNKPGTIGEQMKNLGIDTDNIEELGSDSESEYGRPGSRVN